MCIAALFIWIHKTLTAVSERFTHSLSLFLSFTHSLPPPPHHWLYFSAASHVKPNNNLVNWCAARCSSSVSVKSLITPREDSRARERKIERGKALYGRTIEASCWPPADVERDPPTSADARKVCFRAFYSTTFQALSKIAYIG